LLDRKVDSWKLLAGNAAMSVPTFILEDGPVLRKEPGPHTKEGGEVLDGIYARNCSSLRDLRLSGRAGGLHTVSVTTPAPAGIVSKDPQVMPT
jgi:hypothetical protein